MTIAIQDFRRELCQSLIQAGITAEKDIITKATAIENFVFGTAQPATPDIEAKAEVKTKKRPEPEAEQVKEPAPEQVAESTPEVETAATYTAEDVKAALMEVAKTQGRDALVAILNAVGASKLSDVKEDDYAKAIELAKTEAA